jgi:hypothetical protein
MEALGALAILAGFGLALVGIAAVVWAIVDAARFSDDQWRQAGQSKVLWLLVIVGVGIIGCLGFGWIGALLYAVIARPALKRARPATWPYAGH